MSDVGSRPSATTVAEASAWFIEFRTGELNQLERDRFTQWIRMSPHHIRAYLQVAEAWAALPAADAQDRFDIEAMIAAARGAPENVVVLPSRPVRAGAVQRSRKSIRSLAAVVCLCALIPLVWLAMREANVYRTGIGEQRTLRLADGSTVELNARSAIRVKLSTGERRVVLLEGQALFKVAKDPQRPFVVDGGRAQVRAVGTEFDVYRKPDRTTVTVVEGRVAVWQTTPRWQVLGQDTADAQPKQFMLAAGEQLAVAPKQLKKHEDVDVAASTAWTQNRLVFEDTPLSDVADEFNRYNNQRLVIVDAELQRVGISGRYSSTDPTALIEFLRAQPALQVVETSEEIQVSRRDRR
ncbi:FecR family protein [Steroidobacter flavus]|uniref:FecR family protein n=1 Tax=Steroidobacter flavus TaxID=1842136 RepID=A0ABV8SZ60_9GAMM